MKIAVREWLSLLPVAKMKGMYNVMMHITSVNFMFYCYYGCIQHNSVESRRECVSGGSESSRWPDEDWGLGTEEECSAGERLGADCAAMMFGEEVKNKIKIIYDNTWIVMSLFIVLFDVNEHIYKWLNNWSAIFIND